MYYRRKILLALLQTFDNRLEKIRLQKLLFLLAQSQKKNVVYDFVPYKFGCFSFQANADLGTLKKYGIVSEKNNFWIKINSVNYLNEIRKEDYLALTTLANFFGSMSTSEMIAYTYKKYPYFAINSTVIQKHASIETIKNISSHKPAAKEPRLFTIGYEGISLEGFLNKLMRHNVKALCDVRKNALSMKYGFSKKQLQTACEGVGIAYYHFPEVGILSGQRKNLNSQSDYDRLFEKYKKENLKESINSQLEILALLKKFNRIALTCFEANIHQCHRLPLAESITNLPDFVYQIKHL